MVRGATRSRGRRFICDLRQPLPDPRGLPHQNDVALVGNAPRRYSESAKTMTAPPPSQPTKPSDATIIQPIVLDTRYLRADSGPHQQVRGFSLAGTPNAAAARTRSRAWLVQIGHAVPE